MSPTRTVDPRVVRHADQAALARFAADVRYSLLQQPRQLPSRYLYDELGSALFEAICRLPWYRITRAERDLLERCGPDVFQHVTPLSTIVELGSGSGEKLRALVESAGRDLGSLDVHLIDLSPSALEQATRTLGPLGEVRVTAHEAAYETGLGEAAATFDDSGRTLVLFLGSNIGNFDPPASSALLTRIRRELRAGDTLLLGADLIKPERDLQLAYDDPLGVSAAFNRNLLIRINRELGGDFDIDQFVYRVVWNAAASRVEMHLVARTDQRVRIAAAELELDIRSGELIWTESSHKYRPDQIDRLLAAAGFRTAAQWCDSDAGFSLTLGEAF